MKGIILAGGSGTRLYPTTKVISKQLLPIYDKPMIFYPLSTLMLAGIRDILIISTPNDLKNYQNLLGTGKNLGLNLSYIKQLNPEGLAQAFILGKKFIGKDNVCLILGDNIFYGNGLSLLLRNSINDLKLKKRSQIFSYSVEDPSRFGIVEIDSDKVPISIEEKPLKPKSNLAVVGLYFYTNDIIEIAEKIKKSKRGEYEISSVNEYYLKNNKLKLNIFSRGYTWLDTGTHDSLLEASNFIKTQEKHSGYKIASLEEISFKMNFISKEQFKKICIEFKNSQYGQYLQNILNETN